MSSLEIQELCALLKDVDHLIGEIHTEVEQMMSLSKTALAVTGTSECQSQNVRLAPSQQDFLYFCRDSLSRWFQLEELPAKTLVNINKIFVLITKLLETDKNGISVGSASHPSDISEDFVLVDNSACQEPWIHPNARTHSLPTMPSRQPSVHCLKPDIKLSSDYSESAKDNAALPSVAPITISVSAASVAAQLSSRGRRSFISERTRTKTYKLPAPIERFNPDTY